MLKRIIQHRLVIATFVAMLCIWVFSTTAASAHPLGNFTINHFARIELERDRVGIHYVVDMAEIPAFQELQTADSDGKGTPSSAELNTYLARVTPQYANGLVLTVDGTRIPLETANRQVTTPPGAGGLLTLRVENDFSGAVPRSSRTTHRLRFENTNHAERLGWREIAVSPADGVAVFNSSAFGNALTDELRAYPQERLAAPLDERTAELSWTTGAVPADAVALRTRNGQPVAQSRDPLAELIAVPQLTPGVALLGLLIAAALGALHAFSPGHGKTVVGAYLIGSRGTLSHAAFLGLTVTITHTAGVFVLGLITLFASQYVVPEQLFPILSFVSGGIVAAIGLSLFVKRLHKLNGRTRVPARIHNHVRQHSHAAHDLHSHAHHHKHDRAHSHTHHEQAHSHNYEPPLHSHGGRLHSHLPPGADGTPVTWRSLFALGISGGLLPCPSALVVLLSSIALHRVGYGLLLVVAFSIGLAGTLTGIGMMFIYTGNFIKRSRIGSIDNSFVRMLPIASAFVIMCLGALICYRAIASAGFNVFGVEPATAAQIEVSTGVKPSLANLGAWAVFSFGLIFRFKHTAKRRAPHRRLYNRR